MTPWCAWAKAQQSTHKLTQTGQSWQEAESLNNSKSWKKRAFKWSHTGKSIAFLYVLSFSLCIYFPRYLCLGSKCNSRFAHRQLLSWAIKNSPSSAAALLKKNISQCCQIILDDKEGGKASLPVQCKTKERKDLVHFLSKVWKDVTQIKQSAISTAEFLSSKY